MPIKTVIQRTSLVAKYVADCTHAGLQSTAAAATAGTELAGGSPPYARKPVQWNAPAASAATAAPVTFDVASGSTVMSASLWDALVGGNYRDGLDVPTQGLSSQGSYTLTVSYAQS